MVRTVRSACANSEEAEKMSKTAGGHRIDRGAVVIYADAAGTVLRVCNVAPPLRECQQCDLFC